jgi:hypothetical protein
MAASMGFIPLNVISKHASEWRCDIDSKIIQNVYFKCMEGYG